MTSFLAHVTVVVSFLTCLGTCLSHELKMGSCPNVDVMEGFDFKKHDPGISVLASKCMNYCCQVQILGLDMLPVASEEAHERRSIPMIQEVGIMFTGLWYVIQKTNAISTCLSLNFFEDNGVLKVKETGKPFGLSIPYVFEEVSQIGTLRVPSRRDPGRMKVTYPVSIIPYMEKDFWVVSTDYVTSAAMFACRHLLVANAQAAIILSREPTLDKEIVKQMRDRFDSFGLNINKLADVDQVNCRRNATLKLDSDHHDEAHGESGNAPVVIGSKPANNETEFIFTRHHKDEKPENDQDNEIGHGRQRRNF